MLRQRLPEARILLLGLLPREESPSARLRLEVAQVSRLIRDCADGEPVSNFSRPVWVTLNACLMAIRLLFDHAQIRSQRCLGDRVGIVVIVLLALDEGLDIDRRNDPRLMSQRAE